MIFAQLFAFAVLVHEALWLCQDGDDYFSNCFLPAFGLFLGRRALRTLHCVLIALCLGVIVRPHWWGLYPALLAALSLLAASFSLRLSNHLVLAWFMALVLCLDLLFQPPSQRGQEPTPFLFAGVQLLVVLTYLFSFFHKLNREYLSPAMSCGAHLGRLYLENRGIRKPGVVKVYQFLGIYATLLLEAALPFLLLAPATCGVGLCLGVLFHLPLGLLCQPHFSTLMYAGLAAFVSPDAGRPVTAELLAWGWPPLLLGLATGLYLGGRFGVSNVFRHRRPAFALQMLFGAYTVAALGACFILARSHEEAWGALPWTLGLEPWGWAALTGVGAAFLFNGLGPYLGLKTEFSLAMFSNLRHEPWCHLLFSAAWRPFDLSSYVQVERIEGLPERGKHKGGWMADLVLTCLMKPEQWQYSSYFFHEGLRLICRSAGPPPVIRVVYVERGERHEVADYAREVSACPPYYLRATLFPYKLPRDPSIPHCA
jgi:hypothetical protein